MVDVVEVAENIYLIDDQLSSSPRLGSVYLLDEEKKALIESGPSTSANAVLAGIKQIGVRLEDIAYIVVTHIHLDHAGGAGLLLEQMPRARVVVHHNGAKHLANPEKLKAGMIEAKGEKTFVAWGEMVATDWDRLQPVRDEDTVRLGDGQVLRFIDAPGHAPHELCIHESRNNRIFTGDAAGAYIEGVVVPVQSPPHFDLELYINTLRRLIKLNASIIYFSHFGTSYKVQENLQAAIDKLRIWDNIVTEAMGENRVDTAVGRVRAQVCAELEPFRKKKILYEILTETLVSASVAALIKYRHEGQNLNEGVTFG